MHVCASEAFLACRTNNFQAYAIFLKSHTNRENQKEMLLSSGQKLFFLKCNFINLASKMLIILYNFLDMILHNTSFSSQAVNVILFAETG